MTNFICVGAAVQDVFLSNTPEFVPACHNPDECFFEIPLGSKININKIDFSTGGGATNAAVTFVRSGQQAIFMGQVGHDPAGEAVLSDLDKESVDASHVTYSSRYYTGYSVLLLAPTGERTIMTYRGASTHFHAENFDLDKVEQHVDWMYVTTMNGHFEILSKLFDQAKARGIKIAFNPGKGELAEPEKLRGLLTDLEILIANKDEMQQVVSGGTMEELARHARNYCPVVIVSDGPNGVVAADSQNVVVAGMYEDVPVIDRTGAGDAFGSGFVAKYAASGDLAAAVIYASANSTSVIQSIGAKSGILRAGVQLHDMPLEIKPF